MEKVYEIYIRTTPQRLWDAIVGPEVRAPVPVRRRIDSDWTPALELSRAQPGAPAAARRRDNLEIDLPRRLVQTSALIGMTTSSATDRGG